MKIRQIAAAVLLAGTGCVTAHADESGCATLSAPTESGTPRSFQVRGGEPVDLLGNAKTVHGKLLVYSDNGLFRAYWQANDGTEKYVLANAGDNAVRLVSTPPQGQPAEQGKPGTTLGPLRVLSCPSL